MGALRSRLRSETFVIVVLWLDVGARRQMSLGQVIAGGMTEEGSFACKTRISHFIHPALNHENKEIEVH